MMASDNPIEQHALTLTRGFYDAAQAWALMQALREEMHWHADSYEAFGRRFELPRLQAWVSGEGIQYRYVDNLLPVQPWNARLLQVKEDIETAVDRRFNAVLLTYYRNGNDSVGWHADDEHELGEAPVIASLSLGASRRFSYRSTHSGEEHELILGNGDLLLMQAGFQENFEHRVPPEADVEGPRINLTYRRVVNFS